MPDTTTTEMVLGVLAALGIGGTAGTYLKPRPGTPADHEQRIGALEKQLSGLEARMATNETTLAEALGRLAESSERLWKATDKLTETVEEMKGTLIRLDVETRFDREERQRNRKE